MKPTEKDDVSPYTESIHNCTGTIIYSYWVIYYLQAGVEPIHIAAQHGQIDVVRLLIDKYKVSTDNSTNVS